MIRTYLLIGDSFKLASTYVFFIRDTSRILNAAGYCKHREASNVGWSGVFGRERRRYIGTGRVRAPVVAAMLKLFRGSQWTLVVGGRGNETKRVSRHAI